MAVQYHAQVLEIRFVGKHAEYDTVHAETV